MQIGAASQSFIHNHGSHGAGKARHDESAEEKRVGNSKKAEDDHSPSRKTNSDKALTPDEKKAVVQLEKRDREVRAHEAAHKAAAGQLAKGGASFDYQRGPDGKLYAAGGEVSISTGAVDGNPEATLRKAEQIRTAALAPAQPSSQDRAVAAQAAMMAAQARSELSKNEPAEDEASIKAEVKQQVAAGEYASVAQLNPNDNQPVVDLHA